MSGHDLKYSGDGVKPAAGVLNSSRALMRSAAALCILRRKKKKTVPRTQLVHALHQLEAHILNSDLVNYNVRSELFKELTLPLMQFNGKQTAYQHTYIICAVD